MQNGMELTIVVPDIHIPHHDRRAVACLLAAIEAFQPQRVVFLGDVMDLERFTRFPRKSKVEDRASHYKLSEVDPCNRMLDFVQENSDSVDFLEGNHEFRVEARLMEYDLIDLYDLVSPRRLLSEGRKNFTYTNYTQKPTTPLPHVKIAHDLIAVHGWTYAKHAAARHVEIAKRYSIVHGDTHRQQSYLTRDPIDGISLKGWSPGSLCIAQPIWGHSAPTEWTQGFTFVWTSKNKRVWTDYTVQIRNGMCILPGGKVLDGSKRVKLVRDLERAA